MKHHTDNVLIAGTPGAYTHYVSKYLLQQGWSVLWPGQDIDVANGRHIYETNYQNFEAQRIHEAICVQANVHPLSDQLPVYYEIPYPGPSEFIRRFTDVIPIKVVISAPTLPPFLEIWRPVAAIVVDIQATEAEDLTVLSHWSKGSYTVDQLKAIRQHYIARYNEQRKQFPQIFPMTNTDVRNLRFEALKSLCENSR
jgi:hypothetical protein